MKYADYYDMRILGNMGVIRFAPAKLERTIVNERWRELGLKWLANRTAKKHYRYLKTCIKQERED